MPMESSWPARSKLYLLTKSRNGRARVESVLMEIPRFALWRTLTNSVERARRYSVVGEVALVMASREVD